MIVTADTLSTPVISSGCYHPGIVLSVLVRIRLRLVFTNRCFSFPWHRVLTYIKFHTSEFFNCWESNRCFLGKQQRLFGESRFCKKFIRSLIPNSLPVLSIKPWLRNEDPSLNGKRNFCYCLSTELIELSISSVVGYFFHVCLLIGSVDSTGEEIGITPVTCMCIF